MCVLCAMRGLSCIHWLIETKPETRRKEMTKLTVSELEMITQACDYEHRMACALSSIIHQLTRDINPETCQASAMMNAAEAFTLPAGQIMLRWDAIKHAAGVRS